MVETLSIRGCSQDGLHVAREGPVFLGKRSPYHSEKGDFLAFLQLGTWIAASAFVYSQGDTGQGAVCLVFAVAFGILTIRIVRRGTYADAGGVVVRGRFWSTRWSWQHIADIRVQLERERLELALNSGHVVPLRDVELRGVDLADPPWPIVILSTFLN